MGKEDAPGSAELLRGLFDFADPFGSPLVQAVHSSKSRGLISLGCLFTHTDYPDDRSVAFAIAQVNG